MRTPRAEAGAAAAARVREGLRRGSLGADARIARTVGEPALLGVALSAVGSSIYFALGVVAGEALGLTPLVFLLAGLFFVVTMLTYVEGNSLHPERGGASTFARYAFDELWSFVAGWAIILDYLIVMAFGAFAISHYLAVFWSVTGNSGVELLIAAGALLAIVLLGVRGITVERLRGVLRLGIVNVVLMLAVIGFGLATLGSPGEVFDTVELGSTPTWEALVFAAVLATAASTGIEAASGLAGDLRMRSAGLRRVVAVGAGAVLVLFGGVALVALMAVPVQNGQTALGGALAEAPVLGVVSAFEPDWAREAFRYAVGAVGALVLFQAANGQMLGVARLSYSLATNRQVPSLIGRLHERRATPYVAIGLSGLLALLLTLPADVDLLAALFAFGAMLTFTVAHVSVIALRFREPDRRRPFRVPGVRVRGCSVPLPALLGALLAGFGWISVIATHEGARVVGGGWMVAGILLYVVYRRSQGFSLRDRFTISAEALQEAPVQEYGSLLVPVFGGQLDDDIVGTAGRLAADQAEEGDGGAVLEVLYVFEIPISLPIDAGVPEERIAQAKKALARAKEVGEEYEGVEVATAMVRGRTAGSAIVSEARRRGVEAIVLAAEAPSRIRGGALLGGRGHARDRSVGETTRYVVEKAPCKVILTAAPAGDEGTRAGVTP